MTKPADYAEMYRVLSAMNDSVRRVAQGLCPKCGAVREDNDCQACGWHSIYVTPFASVDESET